MSQQSQAQLKVWLDLERQPPHAPLFGLICRIGYFYARGGDYGTRQNNATTPRDADALISSIVCCKVVEVSFQNQLAQLPKNLSKAYIPNKMHIMATPIANPEVIIVIDAIRYQRGAKRYMSVIFRLRQRLGKAMPHISIIVRMGA
jgi:hypothetical protein